MRVRPEIPQPGGTVSPPTLKGISVVINPYVDDCDKLYKQAVSAGVIDTDR